MDNSDRISLHAALEHADNGRAKEAADIIRALLSKPEPVVEKRED
jgi:hypothetical protein